MATNGGSGNAPTVVIIGAGAAGIFTAYQINKQWPGRFNVQIFEASQDIGGNVSSQVVQYGGQPYTIDAGAQFFYAKAQPNYSCLIQELGLDNQTPLYPAGITIWENSTNQRLLWIPSRISGFLHYTLDDWKRVVEFGGFVVAAALLNEVSQPNWTLSVDNWLADVPLDDDFKQNVIKNFLYQFVSLPFTNIGEASAVYATTYFVRNVIGGPATATLNTDIATFETNQSLIGLLGILEKALIASGVSAQTNSTVTAVAPGANGVAITVNGKQIDAQYVVMACDPGAAATILINGGTANQDLIKLLQGLANQYLNLSIVMQKDGSCWMPGDQSYWEAVSTVVDSPKQTIAFNAWFGPLRPPYGNNQLIPVFKSWGSPDLQSDGCSNAFFSHVHNVMLPTPTFMTLRSQLDAYQGLNGLLFAGGWTDWFDSQEAALMSAINATNKLQPPGLAQPVSQPAIEYDPSKLTGQVRSWLEMVLQASPETHKSSFIQLINQLA